MLKEKNNEIRKFQVVSDLALTTATFFLAYFFRKALIGTLGPIQPLRHFVLLLYIILPLWGYFFYRYSTYGSIRIKHISKVIWPVAKAVFTGGIAIMTILYILQLGGISRTFILIFLAVNFSVHAVVRCMIFYTMRHIRKKGYNFRSILVIGTGKRAKDFASLLEAHREWGVRVIGFVDHEEKGHDQWTTSDRIVGSLSELQNTITRLQVDEVAFVLPRDWLDKIEDHILICENIGIKVSIAADLYPLTISRTTMDELGGWPVLRYNPIHRIESLTYAKRAFDIISSSIALFLLSPVLLACLVAIKISSPGPVFFRQERCGLNGRRFNLLKFRTMVADAEKLKSELTELNEMSGPVFKIKEDPRVTGIGRFLRKYSLDEIPQFINVFKGDMSLVGPRPPVPQEVMQYDYSQRRRLSIKPGITGLWQVSGRNNVGFADWVRLDLEYIDRWSIWLDLKIILRTFPTVLKGTGY